MNNIKLEPQKFQRTSRKFFKTSIINDIVFLHNKKNKNTLQINFNYDTQNAYIRLLFSVWNYQKNTYSYINLQVKKPTYNRDLFIYLLKYNYLQNGKIN